jgi:hypothetical protein
MLLCWRRVFKIPFGKPLLLYKQIRMPLAIKSPSVLKGGAGLICIISLSGNPAILSYKEPVVLRPSLTTGLLFSVFC